jgi:hypothetical protein
MPKKAGAGAAAAKKALSLSPPGALSIDAQILAYEARLASAEQELDAARAEGDAHYIRACRADRSSLLQNLACLRQEKGFFGGPRAFGDTIQSHALTMVIYSHAIFFHHVCSISYMFSAPSQNLRPPRAARSPAFTRPRPRPCRRRRSVRPRPSRQSTRRSARPIIAIHRRRHIRAPRPSSRIRKAAVCRPFTRTRAGNATRRRRPMRRSTSRTAAAARRPWAKWRPRASRATALQSSSRRSTIRLAPPGRKFFAASAGGCHSFMEQCGQRWYSIYRPWIKRLLPSSFSFLHPR